MSVAGYYSRMAKKEEAPYFLDLYTGASLAWSDRKLADIASGGVLRRIADDAPTDLVYSFNRKPNESVLDIFSNGGEVAVEQLFDQTGNNNHATALTQAKEPTLYDSSGNITNVSGEPIIKYNQNLYQSLENSSFTSSQTFTICVAVILSLTDSDTHAVFDSVNASNQNVLFRNNGLDPKIYYAAGSGSNSASAWLNSIQIISVVKVTTTTADVYLNETKIMAGVSASNIFNGLRIGDVRGTSPLGINGLIGTTVLWPSNQSSNIQDIIADMKALYNIT